MLRRRFFLSVVFAGLVVILSACGTQSPQGVQPSEELWTEEEFGTYLESVGKESSLVSAISSSNGALASLAGIPSGGPISNLSALANPGALQNADGVAGLMQGLASSSVYAPATNGGAQPLPTGIWEFNKFKNTWSYLGHADHLVVKFYWGNIPFNGTYTYMTLSVDWDAHSATTTASRDGQSYEVPTGLKIKVNKDGIDAGYISIYADWYKACNGVTQLEPSGLKIKGDFSHEGGDVAVDFEVNISRHDGHSHLTAANNSGCSCAGDSAVTIKSDGYVRVAFDGSSLLQAATNSKDDLAKVTWNNVFYGKETRDANCQWQDLKIKNGEIDFGVKFKLNGKEDTLQLRFTFDNIVKNQNGIISVEVDGKIKVNGETVVLFEGILDASGKNLNLTFSKTGLSLADFAGKYLGNVELPSLDFLLQLGLDDLPSLPF